jgi:LmbE family N-acetylglucosaminyl deacetylase
MVKAIGEEARRTLRARAGLLAADKLRALSPLLLIIPHADDEVLGCGGLIAEASDLNLEVRIVYLTDGAASHLGSPTWPPARLASTRRDEALRALAVLGVSRQHVLFLDWPDSKPHPPYARAFSYSARVVVHWSETSPPRSVWAPYRGEDHCDHQAAWALASTIRRLWTSPPKQFEYLVWGWNRPNIAECLDGQTPWLLPCGHQIARRRHALACHATQLGTLIHDAVNSFALPAGLTALTECSSEIFLES